MIMKEDYVSYEVAKLLEEKGFDWECEHVIWEGADDNYENYDKAIPNPTHQMAMKWLREKYYIYADPIKQGNYNDCSEYYTWIVARMGIIHRNPSVADKLSYKEAVEAALKYCLENLI